MMRARLAAAPLLAAALLAWPPGAGAEAEAGPTFPPALDGPGAPLRLSGAGAFRWKWLIKVYEAALYVPRDVARPDPAADQARRLEFSYHVEIGRDGFGRAADDLLARNVAPEVLARLRERVDRLHAAYVDVRPGDRYALTYQPGQGTELTHNGRRLALVEGADFARAYFAIWLGEDPIDAGLRDRLLGR